MRKKNTFVALSGIIALLGTSLVVSSANADTSLSVGGVTLTVPSNIYEPSGYDTIKVNFSFANQSGKEILSVGYSVTDAIGKEIAYDSKIGVPAGTTGLINSNWYGSSFSKATKPLTITLIIKSYGGLGDQITSAPLTLLSQPGSVPAPAVTVTAQPKPAPTVTVTAEPKPAPTVTVTAEPSLDLENLNLLLETLKTQNSNLTKKIKKICSAKPKPKGC